MASLQTKKAINKESSSKQLAKGKAKFVKDKNTFANTSCYCYKEHVASNNLSNINTKSSSLDLLESNKDEVIKVIAYS